MRYLFYSGIKVGMIVLIAAAGCKKNADSIPECIQAKIDSVKQQPQDSVAATVHMYILNEKKMYLFSATCCNDFVRVYDAECNYICSPSGGPNGLGDGGCPSFYQDAFYLGMIWKEER